MIFSWEVWIVPLLVLLGCLIILLILRRIVFYLLHRWAKKTQNDLDELIIGFLKTPSLYGCLAIALYGGVAFAELPLKAVTPINKTIHVIVIFSLTIAAANLVGGLFRRYIHKSQLPLPTTGLAYGIIKGSVFIIGFLIILAALGVSITPLLTALGVGGLAVALALRDTLANLFAGVHILLEKSIRIGDFIRLESSQEGTVEDITWRTTRIRMLLNNMVVIPNKRLADSVVINYHLPEKKMSLSIPVSVSYAADPARVEEILRHEMNKAVLEIPGLAGEGEVRLIPGFGESSLDFTLVCPIREITEQFSVQHELRKRIFKRFKEEGIVIPFPHRTVYLKTEAEKK
jgi:small-conductance mechanosensitive channel